MLEYDEADAQIWDEAPPRDGVDEYAREVDPFYAAQADANREDGWPYPDDDSDLKEDRRAEEAEQDRWDDTDDWDDTNRAGGHEHWG